MCCGKVRELGYQITSQMLDRHGAEESYGGVLFTKGVQLIGWWYSRQAKHTNGSSPVSEEAWVCGCELFLPGTPFKVEEPLTQKDFHCVWEEIMWEGREECVGILLDRSRGGDVKIWFGLRPEQGICLDVTHERDCLLNLSATKPLHVPLLCLSECCVHLHRDALVNLSLSSNVINPKGKL